MRHEHAEQVIQIVLAEVRITALVQARRVAEEYASEARSRPVSDGSEEQRTASDQYEAAMEIVKRLNWMIESADG